MTDVDIAAMRMVTQAAKKRFLSAQPALGAWAKMGADEVIRTLTEWPAAIQRHDPVGVGLNTFWLVTTLACLHCEWAES